MERAAHLQHLLIAQLIHKHGQAPDRPMHQPLILALADGCHQLTQQTRPVRRHVPLCDAGDCHGHSHSDARLAVPQPR
jgi:hypothetical protein